MSKKRLYSGASPAQVEMDLRPLIDFHGPALRPEQLKKLIEDRLMPHLLRYDQSLFQSMFNAFPQSGAKLGAQIALEWNQGVTNWQVSPGGAMLEELCCRALCNLFNLDKRADATFMYSGTYANQEALYLALHRLAENHDFDLARKGLAAFDNSAEIVVLASQDAHFSVRHAVRMLGLGEDSLIKIQVDERRRMDVNALQSQIDALHKHGKQVASVVATAGATSTGAVDPLEAIAEVCQQRGIWLHVDGAYGYAYKLVPEWSNLFAGDHWADSITWDPHKQMGVPIPNSVLFVRNRADFDRMSLYSSYFNREEDQYPNPGLKSPPSTRPLQALPLVAAIRSMGLEGLIEELRDHLEPIRELAARLRQVDDVELLHEPDTGILCFRMKPAGIDEHKIDLLQQQLYDRVMSSGERSISITNFNGQNALRVVIVSSVVRFEDLLETVEVLRREAKNLSC